jgi:hypothetical protein
LTAQQQTEINTGIPVFATTVTRDAAFGGAGEKALAEGQFAYIEATNTTQYYDGAAWQTVGITPGLVCVKAETAFTTASSVTVDNVFTSSYTNYRIMIRQLGTSNTTTEFRLRVGGVTASATNYIFQRLQGASSSAAASLATGQTYFQILGPNGAFINTYIFELFSPAEASPTGFMTQQIKNDGSYTTVAAEIIYGTHTLSTAYDGFIFAPQGGTVTGTYTIYGYGKSV